MKDGSESSDSTFVFDEFVASAPPNDESVQIEAQDSLAPSDEHSTVSMSESCSDTNDSGPEVWYETDEGSSESDNEAHKLIEGTPVSHLTFFVCLFLSFFQLCFRISDRALSLLLQFFSALLKHICSHVNNLFCQGFSFYNLLTLKTSEVKQIFCKICCLSMLPQALMNLSVYL